MALDFGPTRASAGLLNERSPGVAAGASSLMATLRYALHTGLRYARYDRKQAVSIRFPVVHCRGGRALCADCSLKVRSRSSIVRTS